MNTVNVLLYSIICLACYVTGMTVGKNLYNQTAKADIIDNLDPNTLCFSPPDFLDPKELCLTVNDVKEEFCN